MPLRLLKAVFDQPAIHGITEYCCRQILQVTLINFPAKVWEVRSQSNFVSRSYQRKH
jgi:hypothetical protein